MLSASPNGNVSRKYRNREQLVVCVAAVVVGNAINLIQMADGVDGAAAVVWGVAFSLVLTVVGLRVGFSSLTATDDGVHVSNTFSSFFLKWSEIERFEIGRWKLLPYSCLIYLRDGRKMHATGIQEARVGDHSAAYMVDDLNAELARRTKTPTNTVG